jgi:DNA-binding response OmpR family regulator
VITGPKTVLLVDHDGEARAQLQAGLGQALADATVVAVGDAQTAIEYLEANTVEVLVADVAPPPDDDLTLLAFVRRQHPNLPVVIVSSLPETEVRAALPQLGAVPIVRKPAAAADVAREIRETRAATVRGRLQDVPLVSVLQVVRLERRTCSLLVRSGERKGRLHFLSGDLVDAYSFELDVDGEEAARHVLAWEMVTIDFERSLHNAERRVHTPLETLLLEVATLRDERRRTSHQEPAPSAAAEPDGDAPAIAPPRQSGDDVDRAEEVRHRAGAGDAATVAGPRLEGSAGPSGARAAASEVARLQASLDDLRMRTQATGELLQELAPLVADVARVLPNDPEITITEQLVEARLEEFHRHAATLARRLVAAATEVREGDTA